LYPWQAAALACGADGASLVVAAPTSGGKSLVAEALVLRRLLATAGPAALAPAGARAGGPGRAWKKAMVVLPYAALVAEKTAHLATVFAPLGLGVRGYAGGGGASGHAGTPLSARGEAVAVLTIEKANAAVDALAREGRLGEVVALVVDEAHMLADPGRGAVLEVALAKLVHARPPVVPAMPAAVAAAATPATRGAARRDPGGLQVVAMSATMAGLPSVCAWLRARLFLTDLRPTPLAEAAYVGGGSLCRHPARPGARPDARAAAALVGRRHGCGCCRLAVPGSGPPGAARG
jgi:DNA polymerase theta